MKHFLLLIAISCLSFYSSAGEITHVYTFGNYTISQAGSYQTISFSNTLLSGKTGEPSLPYEAVSLLLPPGEIATAIRITGEEETVIPGAFMLYPRQEVRPISQGPSGQFMKNEAIYQSTSPYPASRVTQVNNQFLNGYSFALCTFTPIVYLPSTGALSYFKKITLTVTTRPDDKGTRALNNLSSSPAAMKRVRMFAQNPEMIETYPAKASLKTGYQVLIITPAQYQSGFADLVDYYSTRSITAQVATTESIYSTMTGQDNQEKIRNYIIQEYQNNNIEHVLLGGDIEYIPYRGLYCYVISGSGYEDYNIPSDLYYSSLDGNWNTNGDSKWGEPGEDDLLPDVSVARMPFSTATELAHMIHKSVTYQGNPVTGELKKPFMVGEFLYDTPMTWGQDYLELILDDHNDNGYFTHGIPTAENEITRLYDTLVSPPNNIFYWDVPTLIDDLNSGVSFIHHCGHSNEIYMMRLNVWDITDQNFSQVDGITHNYELMYSHGCLCGAFDSDDCIAEKCVTIGNFLVAGIFNSRYGWFDQGLTEGPSAHLHREFISALYNDTVANSVSQIGTAHMVSKIMTAPWVGLPGEFEPGAQRWCHYDCNVFGDPAMKVWIDEPTTGIGYLAGPTQLGVSPNPAHGQATVTFTTDLASGVNLSLYNTTGQRIATLFSGRLEQGAHRVPFATNTFAPGIYILQLETGKTATSTKLVIAE